jgi:hypothetical protein
MLPRRMRSDVGRDVHADGGAHADEPAARDGGAEPALREADQGQDDGRDEREHGEREMSRRSSISRRRSARQQAVLSCELS